MLFTIDYMYTDNTTNVTRNYAMVHIVHVVALIWKEIDVCPYEASIYRACSKPIITLRQFAIHVILWRLPFCVCTRVLISVHN